jgi:ABC-2 type transport system ATP-binding protein
MSAAGQVYDIEARGLRKAFGARVAVREVTLAVRRGEAFALVGPDGAGKTTLMRLLVGIMDPDGGEARVLGYDTVAQAEELKEHIGYMPQRFGLYDDLTVRENLLFYFDLYGVPRGVREERLPGLLAFAGLAPFQDRLAAQLSGGMRQKLGLICALSHRPRVLFLDEPTFGVDPVSRREFWEILQHLLQEGMTIFLSTAYLDEAERSHRVGLLHDGRLLAVDTPEGLKAAFAGELLEVRAGDLLRARELLTRAPGVEQVLTRGDHLTVTVSRAEEAAPGLRRLLTDAGLGPVELSPTAPGLEDCFVQLVRRPRQDAAEG